MSKADSKDHLQAGIQELETRYEQLRLAYTELTIAHEELKKNKNLLIETVLTIQAKEKKHAAIIDNSPGALFLSKMDGSILEANRNACDMLGYTEAELKQIGRFGFMDHTDPALLNALAEREKIGKIRGEFTVIKKNDERLLVDMSSFVFKDQLSGEERISTVMIDITEKKQVELALQKSNELVNLIFNTTTELMFLMAVEPNYVFRCIKINPAYSNLTGLAAEQVIGKTLTDFLPENAARYATDKYDKAIKLRRTVIYEEAVLLPVGNIIIETKLTPVFNDAGKCTLLLGVANDITEQKKSEEAVRISNERYLYVTQATFDAIWDWDIVNDHLYWGEGYEKIFGYKISNKIENHIHSFDNIHPDDRKSVFEGIDKLIQSKELNWLGGYRYLKANGEYAYVQDKAIIIRDANGKAVRMIGAMQDVTKQKMAREVIEKTQKKFSVLVNAVDGIVWEADARTFQFTFVSNHAEKLLGYPTQQWIDEPEFWANHIHPDDRNWTVEYCVSCTREKKNHKFEYRMIAASGEVVWLADFVTVSVEMDEPVQLQGIMVDITERKKAEEHLKLLESVITNATDSIVITEAEPIDFPGPKIIYVNDAFTKMTGYLSEEVVGKTPRLLQGPKSDRQALKKVRQALENREPCETELINYRKNGEIFWISFSLVPVTNDNGRVTHWISIEREITERKKAEEALVKERKLLRILIDNIPDYIYVKDRESRYITSNKGIIELYGYTSGEEIFGKTAVDILGEEIAGAFLKDDQRVLQSGQPIINREEPIYNKNGDKHWLLTTKIPLKDEQNNIIGLVGISRDITESKKAVQALAESENYLRTIINTEPECIKLLNINGELEDMNPAGLAMIEADSVQQVKGKLVLNSIINKPYRKAFKSLTQNVFKGQSETLEFEITGLKGTHRWLETHAVPLKNAEGKIISLLSISRDVTQRKKTDEELKEKNAQLKNLSKYLQRVREEERKSLAREVHDELGQLASVVKMDIDWLGIRLTDLQPGAKKRIQHASGTADLMINTIRKIASALRPSMLDEFGLNASLQWQCKEFTSVNGIPCLFEQIFNDDGLSMEITTELFRICQESLTNVMRHAAATCVKVNITDTNNGILLCINDNGKGFETEQKKNTLGLIGMRERALSIKGILTIKSEPGKGTTICVIIPKNEVTI